MKTKYIASAVTAVSLCALLLVILFLFLADKTQAEPTASETELTELRTEKPADSESQTLLPETLPETEVQTEEPIETAELPDITYSDQWATITIDSAGVYDIPVFHGGGDSLSMRGICHFMNSRFPGEGGRIVLYGHVGISRFFQRLETMKIGDLVTLNTIYGDYVYEVTRTEIRDRDDISWTFPLDDESEDELVCYTCYPYRTYSERVQRFVIFCKRISGPDVSYNTAY